MSKEWHWVDDSALDDILRRSFTRLFLFPAVLTVSERFNSSLLPRTGARYFFPVILILTIIFCPRARKSRQILEWKNRNGAVWDTEGFIIGSRCTGRDIKLSYAHLGIFYYHREQRNTLFPPEIRYGVRILFFLSFLLVFPRSSQQFGAKLRWPVYISDSKSTGIFVPLLFRQAIYGKEVRLF